VIESEGKIFFPGEQNGKAIGEFPLNILVMESEKFYSYGHLFYRSLRGSVVIRYYFPSNEIETRSIPYYDQKKAKNQKQAD